MTAPKTLLQLAGADLTPATLREASLVFIDLQNEYLSGPIAVAQPGAVIRWAEHLLAAARAAGAPVFHIAHRGRSGGLFDRGAPRGQIVAPLAQLPSEPVVENCTGKPLMNNVAGGGGGIRTLETVSRLHAFQACAFNHSATPPGRGSYYSGGEGDRKT